MMEERVVIPDGSFDTLTVVAAARDRTAMLLFLFVLFFVFLFNFPHQAETWVLANIYFAVLHYTQQHGRCVCVCVCALCSLWDTPFTLHTAFVPKRRATSGWWWERAALAMHSATTICISERRSKQAGNRCNWNDLSLYWTVSSRVH